MKTEVTRSAFPASTSAVGLVLVLSLFLTDPVRAQYAFTNFVGLPGVSGTNDGTGTAARFYGPQGGALDSAGNLFVPDLYNHTIRKVTPAGEVTTLAGTPGVPGSADGAANSARFNEPRALALDSNGDIFVPDWGNHTIRKVTPAGVVTTLAGSPGSAGWADATGSAARFNMPEAVAVDSSGNVFVAERQNHIIRKVTPAGVVTTLAGQPGSHGWADGVGAAALFNDPSGIAVDSSGDLFVADLGNESIRKVTQSGAVTTLAGSPGNPGWADGLGAAARFDSPCGMAVDSRGNIFVTDEGNHTIRKVSYAGLATTLGGLAGVIGIADGIGTDARFKVPVGVSVSTHGDLYISDAENYRITRGTPCQLPAPIVSTGTATPTSPTSAIFTGTVNPKGLPTTAQFQYGPSSAYGNTTNVLLLPNNGLVPQAVSTTVTNLQSGTTYHFRLIAFSSAGAGVGDDASFVAGPLPFLHITNAGTITITKYTGSGGSVDIPSTINGLPVTAIGDEAFAGCVDLTSVTIPVSILHIGSRAFNACTSLTSVRIPDGVTSIGDESFDSCASLTNVTIGNSVTNIGSSAFQDCSSLAGITIPGSVTIIGEAAFFSCTSLTSITIPNSVSHLGIGAFCYCNSLTNAFIGKSITSLENGLFSYCANLTTITIPSNVTSIGDYAFESCSSLVGITIPDTVTTIGEWAFFDCYNLASITIPNSVTRLGSDAFGSCASLTNVQIGIGITTIEFNVFGSCVSLVSLALPVGITNIAQSAFSFCTSLTNLMIPNSVTALGDWVFAECTSLASIVIPASVSSIGAAAFYSCTNLTRVYFGGGAPLPGADVFSGADNATVYYLPGTTGWGPTYADRPTAFWVLPYPVILGDSSYFGVQTNAFGFLISWASNATVVVDASTTITSPVWSPVSTNTLANGTSYFTDPNWASYPSRFYRVRSL